MGFRSGDLVGLVNALLECQNPAVELLLGLAAEEEVPARAQQTLTHTPIRTCTQTQTHRHTHTQTQTDTHRHTQTHTRTHTHTHTTCRCLGDPSSASSGRVRPRHPRP